MATVSRRELFRRSALLTVPAFLRSDAADAACRRSAAAARGRGPGRAPREKRLSVDRRPPADQRARHLHHHQRLAHAAGGPRRHRRGRAAARAPGRTDGGDRRAARGTDEGGMGHGLVRLFGRPDARDRRLRRRRQSRSPRADSEPDRICERRSHHPDDIRATSTTRPSAPSACASSTWARPKSSKRRSARGPRWSTSSPARTRIRARSARKRSRPWRARRTCPCWSTPPPRSSPSPTSIWRTAPRWSATAAANACAARRARGCCWDARTWCRPPGSTARRITALPAAMKVGKEEAIGMLMAVEMWTKTRPQGRVEPVALLARRHREARLQDRWRHDGRDGNDGAVEPHAVAVHSMGSEAVRDHRRGRRQASHGDRAAHRHAGRTGP